jgi:hypothetical protein
MIHMTEALSMTAPPPTWHLMRFHAPDGRDELPQGFGAVKLGAQHGQAANAAVKVVKVLMGAP